MNMIKVTIDPRQNKISVWNNGKGIPITIHKEQNCYLPEMIFGKYFPQKTVENSKNSLFT